MGDPQSAVFSVRCALRSQVKSRVMAERRDMLRDAVSEVVSACCKLLIINVMAEREGFEPPIPVKVCLISSQVHSTGLCHLSVI